MSVITRRSDGHPIAGPRVEPDLGNWCSQVTTTHRSAIGVAPVFLTANRLSPGTRGCVASFHRRLLQAIGSQCGFFPNAPMPLRAIAQLTDLTSGSRLGAMPFSLSGELFKWKVARSELRAPAAYEAE